MIKKNSGLVFSTEFGRLCPDCENPVDKCSCGNEQPKTGDGVIRVGYETKGRKGKGVTLVTGLLESDAEIKQLAKKLKQRCSTGGAVKDGVIEIQGDQRSLVVEALQKQGYTVKKAGG